MSPAFRDAARPRVGVSRCLLGDDVRYDGGHKREPQLIEALAPYVEWVPVCPEVEIGMGTPREPIHLVTAGDGVPSGAHRVRLVGVYTGADWTGAMDQWRSARILELSSAGLCGFVLKQGSPSCGARGVAVRIGDRSEANGRGLFAQALVEAMPDLPIEEEDVLRDPRVRESFLTRVRAFHHERCLRTDR